MTVPTTPTIDDLKAAYDVARRAYHAALINAFQFKVGDIVRSTKGAEAHVRDVFIRVADETVHATAVLRNKDGTFGQRDAEMGRQEWRNAEKIGFEPWLSVMAQDDEP